MYVSYLKAGKTKTIKKQYYVCLPGYVLYPSDKLLLQEVRWVLPLVYSI